MPAAYERTADARYAPADFPVNTHGGLLAFGAPWEVPAMYNIIEACAQLNGAVRHAAESFNYYWPQDLDDEYLVVWDGFRCARACALCLVPCAPRSFLPPPPSRWHRHPSCCNPAAF